MKKDHSLHPPLNTPLPDHPAEGGSAREVAQAQGLFDAPISPDSQMSSRFVEAHHDVGYTGDTFVVHDHPFHEMVCCISGNAEYQIDTEHYHLSKGDILSIPAGLSHSFTITESPAEPYRRYVLRMNPEFSQLILNMFLTDTAPLGAVPYVLHTAGTVWEPLSEYFRRCVQECEQKLYRWDASVFGIATELLVQIARAWQGSQDDAAAKPELLDQIMSYVEVHLSEKITLPDIAARFWVSQSTISQLFRKKMGISFYRYVTLRRLREAQVLIRSGIAMDQVSISVGFQDYSTFYRAFKAEYGISPAQYRKQTG